MNYNSVLNPKSGQYKFSKSEKADLLKRLNAEHFKNWDAQKEYRRRCTKLEDYVAGRQVWDGQSGRRVGHEVAGAPSDTGDVDDEYFIFNIVRRIHLSNIQRLMGYDININLTPNSRKPEDKAGARFGKLALNTLFDKMGEEKLKRKIAHILGLYGTVFLKGWFDPSKGRRIHPIEWDELIQRFFVNERKSEPEGECVLEVFSPRNIIMPKFCRDLSIADRLTEVHVETCDWGYRNFGLKLEPESINFQDWDNPAGVDTNQPDKEWQLMSPERAFVMKAQYVRPCPEFEQGAIFFFNEKELIRSTELLKWYDDIPFKQAQMIFDEKSCFGDTPLWDIIPIQESMNNDLTAMVNHVKMYGDLQMQAPATANLKLDKINNATGQVYSYQGDKGADYLRPPELQQSHFQVFNLLNQVAQSLGAAHDISRSNRALSGNALATLQQIDDSVLKPAITSIGEMLEDACRDLTLPQIEEYYSNERRVKMSGMEGWQIEESFKGAMINGNYDVKINLMTGLSNNPAVRQETIFKAHKEGLLTPQEARVHMQFADLDGVLEEIQKDNEVADKLISELTEPESYKPSIGIDPTTGQPVEKMICKIIPEDFDNHELIIKKLTEYMRENFRHLEHQFIKEELRFQLRWHQQFMAALMMPSQKGPAPESFSPGAQPPPEAGKSNKQNAEGKPAGHDSVQNSSQQPSARMPQPAASGMTQA